MAIFPVYSQLLVKQPEILDLLSDSFGKIQDISTDSDKENCLSLFKAAISGFDDNVPVQIELKNHPKKGIIIQSITRFVPDYEDVRTYNLDV